MIETQLALRGQMYPDYCAKALFTNPASARPPIRSDGYKQRGPHGAQVMPAKASVVNDAKASVLLPPPPPAVPKATVVPPRPKPPAPEDLALPLPKFLPAPLPPPPLPMFPVGLPPELSYGSLQPPSFYRTAPAHPYLKPKAKSRYPFREASRAT